MTQVFENTEWTDFLWEDHQRFKDSARKAIRRGVKSFAEKFKDFGDEAFYRFYSKNPAKKEEPTEGSEWAEKLHKCMEEVPDFQTLKDYCGGSDWKSGIATTAMIEELLKKVTPPENPFSDTEQDQEVVDYLEQLLQEEDLTDKQRGELTNNLKTAQQSLDKKTQQNADNSKLLDETQLRNAVRAAAGSAKSEISNIENAMIGLGCGTGPHDANSRGSMSARKLVDTIKANPKLQEILKMAGRLKRLAQQKQKAKPKLGTNEFSGVLSGDDISRMLPSEAMLLMDPDMEFIFARKFQERALLEYELKEKPEEERGPIVMLLDCSGSMSYGSRDVWASAVALAFLGVAREQKRDFALLHFSDDVRKTTLFEGKKPVDQEKLVETVLACGSSGGTNFEKPLASGVKVIEHFGAFKKADVIMVSDGDASVSDEFLKTGYIPVKKALEVSCYTILLGSEGNKENTDRFSDQTVRLQDVLKDEHKMHELFGKV